MERRCRRDGRLAGVVARTVRPSRSKEGQQDEESPSSGQSRMEERDLEEGLDEIALQGEGNASVG